MKRYSLFTSLVLILLLVGLGSGIGAVYFYFRAGPDWKLHGYVFEWTDAPGQIQVKYHIEKVGT